MKLWQKKLFEDAKEDEDECTSRRATDKAQRASFRYRWSKSITDCARCSSRAGILARQAANLTNSTEEKEKALAEEVKLHAESEIADVNAQKVDLQ